MGSLLTFLLPALAPAVSDAVRGLVAKFTGNVGAQPMNVAERVQLMEAETKRLQAMAQLDTPTGTPSQWIIDLRAVFRYFAIIAIWVGTFFYISQHPGVSMLEGDPIAVTLVDMCGATLSFIIGERFYLHVTGKTS
jgi:hypothetical protein